MGLRITTWNVNGIRNPFSYQPWRDKRSFVAMFEILEADIVVLQETKIQRKDLSDDMVLVPGWDCYFSLPRYEKGKFGVVIYTRQSRCAPIRAEEGITGVLYPPNSTVSFRDLPVELQIGGYPTPSQALSAPNVSDIATDFQTLDSEGRCVMLEFPAFVLIGVYSPATRDESRNPFRIGFLNLLDARVRNLIAIGKRVVLAGDLNISKSEIDVANCEADLRKAGTTVEDYFSRPARRLLNHLLDDGTTWGGRDASRSSSALHDLCRSFHPQRKGMFTCWETKINARPGNYGSRIDYVLCSLDMENWFSDANIQEGLMGSDHCPVYALTKKKVSYHGEETHIEDIMNPPGMFKKGVRIRQYSTRDLQPLSGRLIPEFSGRRSIKDMFTREHKFQSIPKKSYGPGESKPSDTSDLALETVRPKAEDKTKLDDSQGHLQHLPSTSDATQWGSSFMDENLVKPGKGVSHTRPAGTLSKRPKSEGTFSPAKRQKSQRTLANFFDSRSRAAQFANVQDGEKFSGEPNEKQPPLERKEPIAASANAISRGLETPSTQDSTIVQTQTRSLPSDSGEALGTAENVIDPVQSKEKWSILFSKPAAPLCESHSESCKMMTTKKPGPNCGRSFWMCSRPLGPSGQKEKGTQWRCGTFIWCSDWSST